MIPGAKEDIALNLDICDIIRSKQVIPKDGMRVLKGRLLNRNPNVQLLSLSLADALFKNGGQHFWKEMDSREFVDVLMDLCRETKGVVGDKAREVVQIWSLITTNSKEINKESILPFLNESYQLALREGISFPAPPSPSMLGSMLLVPGPSSPPEWTDSPTCERCRESFGIVNRKHHCRQCGRTFCQECSSKSLPLPLFGLTEPVRVCETCYATLKNPSATKANNSNNSDIEKAIALSLKDGDGSISSNGNSDINDSSGSRASLQPSNLAEEDAIAQAISASLSDNNAGVSNISGLTTGQQPQSQKPEQQEEKQEEEEEIAPLISSLERENIILFSQFIAKITSPDDPLLKEVQFQTFCNQMAILKRKLGEYLAVNADDISTRRMFDSINFSLTRLIEIQNSNQMVPSYPPELSPDINRQHSLHQHQQPLSPKYHGRRERIVEQNEQHEHEHENGQKLQQRQPSPPPPQLQPQKDNTPVCDDLIDLS